MITAFLDVEFIKSKIVEAYPNLSATKQKTVSEDIRLVLDTAVTLLNRQKYAIYIYATTHLVCL